MYRDLNQQNGGNKAIPHPLTPAPPSPTRTLWPLLPKLQPTATPAPYRDPAIPFHHPPNPDSLLSVSEWPPSFFLSCLPHAYSSFKVSPFCPSSICPSSYVISSSSPCPPAETHHLPPKEFDRPDDRASCPLPSALPTGCLTPWHTTPLGGPLSQVVQGSTSLPPSLPSGRISQILDFLILFL